MEALVTLLTRERLLVELLVFKLVSLRQLLLAGETRFLPWAAEEVDRASTAVRDAELERAVLVAGLGAERGLDEASLTELVADAPVPWQGLLEECHTALRKHALEVQDLLQTTRRLADVGARSIAEAMGEDAGPPAATYSADGRAEKTRASRYQQVL
jgi:hypothetical protein